MECSSFVLSIKMNASILCGNMEEHNLHIFRVLDCKPSALHVGLLLKKEIFFHYFIHQ